MSYVLGLNGFSRLSHHASACIVQNGKILAMAEEERFIRKKKAYNAIPLRSTMWCLETLNLSLDDIDVVAVGWDYKRFYENLGIQEPGLNDPGRVYFPKKYFRYKRPPRFEFVPHHTAHAYSAYYLSGMDKASILIVDGQGEDASTTFAVGESGKVKVLWSLPVECSLGFFYEIVSGYIGLGFDGAGKTMGLAPYGDRYKYDLPQFVLNDHGFDVKIDFPRSDISNDLLTALNEGWWKQFDAIVGQENDVRRALNQMTGKFGKKMELPQKYKDLAAAAQRKLEDVLCHCIRLLVGKTGHGHVCFCGGVALNCSSNSKIYGLDCVDDLFIPPFANDSGVSAGAALCIDGNKSSERFRDPYLGPSYDTSALHEYLSSLKIAFTEHDNIEEVAAELLAEGKIISWFQSAAEVGPRALGNRSIIANPRIASINGDVNKAKSRHPWRPLAPSMLETHIDEYLENPFVSPFMLHSFYVKEEKKGDIPAVVHIDGTTRPQTVRRNDNHRFFSLIDNFRMLTGTPVVLNTSFNGAKEPIVCTPGNALSSFYTNSTDCLVIDRFLVRKQGDR